MSRPRDHARGLALGALVSRLADLERRLMVAEAREREQLERIDGLSSSLHVLWHKYEGLRSARRPGGVETQTEASRPMARKRVPLAAAARALGLSRKHTLKLAEAGNLDLADLRIEGAPRAVWTVCEASVERLLDVRKGRPDPLEHATPANAGRREG